MRKKKKYDWLRYLLCLVLYLITLWIAMNPSNEEEPSVIKGQTTEVAPIEKEEPLITN